MFYIGITFEKEVFKVGILKKDRHAVLVDSVHTFSYGPDNVKLFYNLPPFHTGEEVIIASGIPSSQTFIRKIHVPLQDKRKILSTLPFQIESLLPFSSSEPIVCTLFKRLSKQMTEVTLIATEQKSLKSQVGSAQASRHLSRCDLL